MTGSKIRRKLSSVKMGKNLENDEELDSSSLSIDYYSNLFYFIVGYSSIDIV